MTIPEQLKIGGHVVKVVKSLSLPDDVNGEFDSRTMTITLDGQLPESLQASTLIHEVFHVLNSTFSEEQMGHALLDSLSEQLYQVLSDNDLLK